MWTDERRRRHTVIALGGVLLATLALCAPAGAAKLYPLMDQYWTWTNVIYQAESGETNHVVVAGQGPHVVLVRDPNIPIRTHPFYAGNDPDPNRVLRDVQSERVPVRVAFNCVAPTNRGQGLCSVIPGSGCNDGGCFIESAFHEIFIDVGAGDDSVTLVPGSSAASVRGGPGNDTLDTRNGAVDYVDCGDGLDTLAADKVDNLFAGCETVTRGRP
jgi:hypothetical protein